MIRTLRNTLKQDKERYKIPRSVQDILPIHTLYKNGIMKVSKNKYAMTWKFSDINFTTASKDDKDSLFLAYSDLLNSFDPGATTKITIANRKLTMEDIEKTVLMAEKGDKLDKYRKEYNQVLVDKASSSDCIVQDHYLTVSICKQNYEDAKLYFLRIGTELSTHFSNLSSQCVELDAVDKVKLLHNFFHPDNIGDFRFNLLETMKKGHSFKDYICPDSFECEKDHFKIGNRFGRVVYLKEYASFISDKMVEELCQTNKNLMLSIDVIPIPTDEAIKEVETRLLGVETNITNWQMKQNANNNWSASIPYDMAQQQKEAKEFLDDLTTRDQRMMLSVISIMITADTKKQLDNDTEALLATGRKRLCRFATLNFQQLDALQTVLPIGVRKINALRTLITESLAAFIPFRVQEIMEDGGTFYGVNAVSHNLILCNKENLQNANSFVLGIPGAGKSFSVKELITFIALSTNDDILICDPENEYGELIQNFGGEVIHIAAGSNHHINAMDMVDGYSDSRNPVIDKSEFIMALLEQLDTKNGLGPKHKSIIDRCTRNVYRDFKKGKGPVPTLIVLRQELLKQSDEEAQDLAVQLELFTDGSLDAFAHETNVNIRSRMVVYDIYDLGKQLKTMGLLVITDAMINRVTENFKKGIRTHVFLDEIHVVFENEYSEVFFSNAWKRFRKRDAYATGITQNVEYMLDSVMATTMLSNSECIVMLNQSPNDQKKLGDLLNISQEQLGYIKNAKEGCGLIKYGSALVPFINSWPKDTELYRLMSTKPKDRTELEDEI